MIRRSLVFVAAMAGLLVALPAAAAEHVKIGTLRCEVSGGLGLIIASSKELECIYTSGNGARERYFGRISKFGLDIGVTTGGALVWDVFAPEKGPRRGALAGDYAGVGASATVGAGLGANALIGGSDRSIALQPLSVETQGGVDLAGGVESLTLRQG
jgi:hypothetical protein